MYQAMEIECCSAQDKTESRIPVFILFLPDPRTFNVELGGFHFQVYLLCHRRSREPEPHIDNLENTV